MEKILEDYLNTFVKENMLGHLKRDVAFEAFVIFCTLSRMVSDKIDLDAVMVGEDGNFGIDGLAVIVNDHVVSSIEEIEYHKNNLRRLDVRFVFIQAKSSEKFDMGDMGNFIFGVENFFQKDTQLSFNSHTRLAQTLKDHIYENAIDMDKTPTCEMIFATSGTWTDDANLTMLVKTKIDALRQTKLFSDVKFSPADAEQTKKIYRELRNKIVKQITFSKQVDIPSINGVTQAHIGVLLASEYLKLIVDDDGNLQRNLFYDNVRDFQGNNPVNSEIEDSIKEANFNDRFSLLNNGVTIVAKSIIQAGSTFTIRDFQIVNGCQTSHVLYYNREFITDKVYLPLKLVATTDFDITNMVIKATNRQTEVKEEAFKSLQPFHKQLEEFYNTFKSDKPLFYERRSKQYDYLTIKENQIISVETQAKCFLAMFLNEPHSTHRYYGELLKAYEGRLFQEGTSWYPYYVSGYAHHLLERLLSEQVIPHKYNTYRYHLMMLFRLLTETSELPYINSKKIESYCADIKDALWDDKKAVLFFQKGIEIIEQVLPSMSYDEYDAIRRKDFTTELINRVSILKTNKPASKTTSSPATEEKEKGLVVSFSEIRGYGFIKGKYEQNIFVHYRDIIVDDKLDFRYLMPNEEVEFVVVKTPKGLDAKKVKVVKKKRERNR